ncbi:2-oxoglutarate-dependent dioxygenase DAO-like [Magnolia sinica]|uniref:2-oxoglutarate-dependent dioxygenase DAO-like n=1 Tax=Magnolia sinica TaxID=86752 RepID=UPI00265910ED|nr:2-oxoglutarate-dependent dioxygenase DAO-like [Magnolia sinica]
MANEIPVIDMEDFPGQLPKLLQACEEWGTFRVVNHKIPSGLLSEMKSVVRSLFDRPPEIKRRNTDTISGSGYVAPNSRNPLYEALGLYDIGSSDAVLTFCSQLDATPQQSETIKSYAHAILELAMDIGRKIAESIGIDCDLCRTWPCQFRINKYSFTKETVASLGVQLHTDSGFLTILQEDDCVGGLEVMDKTGAFLAVDPFPGSLLVNLGDVAKVWSNGRFYNVKHQVQCKEAATRISIAMFILGPKVDAVEAPPELVDVNNPRLYLPFTYEDYRKCRLSTGMRAGEALVLFSTKQN